MLRLLLLSIILINATFCYSQFSTEATEVVNEKEYFIGGSLFFQSTENTNLSFFGGIPTSLPIFFGGNDQFKSTYGSISLSAGKQLNTHWIAGLSLGLNRRIQSNSDFGNIPDDFKFISNQTNVGAFTRYIMNPNHKFQGIVSSFVIYSQSKSYTEGSFQGPNDEFKSKFINVGISVGAMYVFHPRFRATVRLGGINYVSGTSEINTIEERDYNSLNLSFSLSSLQFGAEYLF